MSEREGEEATTTVQLNKYGHSRQSIGERSVCAFCGNVQWWQYARYVVSRQ